MQMIIKTQDVRNNFQGQPSPINMSNNRLMPLFANVIVFQSAFSHRYVKMGRVCVAVITDQNGDFQHRSPTRERFHLNCSQMLVLPVYGTRKRFSLKLFPNV
jgi:hypothetical protein